MSVTVVDSASDIYDRIPAESIRYFIQSVAGLLVGLALLTLWVDGAGIAPQLAVFINWALLGVVNCAVLDRWVFDDADPATTLRGFANRFVGMQAAMISSKGVNYVIYVVLIEVGIFYQGAWVVGAGVSFVMSFILNRRWFGRALS